MLPCWGRKLWYDEWKLLFWNFILLFITFISIFFYFLLLIIVYFGITFIVIPIQFRLNWAYIFFSPIPTIILFKYNIPTDNYLSINGIIEWYALNSSITPNRAHVVLRSSNLISSIIICHMHMSHTYEDFGISNIKFSPLQASFGVMFFTASVGLLLRTCISQLTSSGYKLFGIFFTNIKLQTIFIMAWFFHSATPLCYGEYSAISYLSIPCSTQKLKNSNDVNSPPRSVHRL